MKRAIAAAALYPAVVLLGWVFTRMSERYGEALDGCWLDLEEDDEAT